jgi:hypothetical protein
VRKLVFVKPMAGTVSRKNGRNAEDASMEDIGRLIRPHMTAKSEVAAMQPVTRSRSTPSVPDSWDNPGNRIAEALRAAVLGLGLALRPAGPDRMPGLPLR